MHIAAEAMKDGTYHKQVERLRRTYAEKLGRTLDGLDRHFGPLGGSGLGEWTAADAERGNGRHASAPPRISWTRPNGGLYVWLTLPPAVDTSRTGPVFAAAVAAGVLYVPGEYCFQPDDHGHVPQNHLRLCFGQVHPDQIEPGIERLASVVGQLLDRQSTFDVRHSTEVVA
jgi:DNA-binding transcriptional MocR family regulator